MIEILIIWIEIHRCFLNSRIWDLRMRSLIELAPEDRYISLLLRYSKGQVYSQ